ncbi:hypothetical protein [Pyxidicoccus sp. MSG2]|uniref:hypothetical protein n=1 Tax=Pyxidicoccus sp. MSG2 TaxID=2996790 RepID=UPI0022702965|nr:hypothetical protein [Pyxidicoccus sp. MSG2]MCY1019141.1 hypothetical protein [Pyxidicoccus sp. MSG2]
MKHGLGGLLLLAAALSLQVACGAVDEAPEAPGLGVAEQATRGLLPDLTVEEISRSSGGFKARLCNRASHGSESTFTVLMTNDGTGSSFQTNPVYPFSVPAPGTCIWTGGISCTQLGVGCKDFITLTVHVDDTNNVIETYEDNNTMTVSFREDPTLPDLTVEEVIRTTGAYHARYCNRGIVDSSATFAMRFRNVATGQSFDMTNPLTVPAQGTCAWTPQLPCIVVGSNCADTIDVQVTADVNGAVSEWSEVNNDAVAHFTPSYALPDLVVSNVWRQGSAYVVSYCNQGLGTSTLRFQLRLMNATSWWTYQTPSYAPLPVPAPGQCAQVETSTCLGPSCWPGSFWVTVDVSNDVFESNESNNQRYMTFP